MIDQLKSLRICGTTLSDAEILAAENHFQANKITPTDSSASASKAIVSVSFHVVSENQTVAGGNVPDSQIAAQIDVLNKAYSFSGITFVLKKTTRTVNQTWFNLVGPGNSEQTEMKNALRQGRATDLNVYTVGFNALEWKDDGVVINSRTLPGGRETNYNLGHTLTHEVGHWVGLFHTFQNGCDGKGDYVDDTPAEAEPAFGCPEGRDTCPGGGKDPIHNYMDYSYDSCMTEFTHGQMKRIREQMATYRNCTIPKLASETLDYDSVGRSMEIKCGTTPSEAQVLAAETHFQAHRLTPEASLSGTPAVVNVYFHYILAADSQNPAAGYISPNQTEAQMRVLNQAYMAAGISFTLVNTTYTVNKDWFNEASPTNSFQTAMKKSLRRGGAADLNVYTVG
ncbi:hypothetical protein C0995_013071 [Termitomyces sp. Mi166|nr:hypothetical protein C0995_013071 [Termitomyces sp. Mi166\